MKQQIRINTFETNSSSTHTMVIIPDDQWEAWENNELYYVEDTWNKDVKEFVEKNNGRLTYSKEELSQAGFLTICQKERIMAKMKNTSMKMISMII